MKAKVGKIITEKEVIEIQLEDNIDIAIILSMLSLVNKEEEIDKFSKIVKYHFDDLNGFDKNLSAKQVANRLYALEKAIENVW